MLELVICVEMILASIIDAEVSVVGQLNILLYCYHMLG